MCGRNMLMQQKIVRSEFVLQKIADFSAQKSVFLPQIYGSFGGW